MEKALPINLKFDESILGRCIDWEIPLGITRYGFIKHDMERGHITLAGATRKGKNSLFKNANNITNISATRNRKIVFD